MYNVLFFYNAFFPVRDSILPMPLAVLPANQTTVVGGDVRFVCRVYGRPRPDILWFKQSTADGGADQGIPYVRVLKVCGLHTIYSYSHYH